MDAGLYFCFNIPNGDGSDWHLQLLICICKLLPHWHAILSHILARNQRKILRGNYESVVQINLYVNLYTWPVCFCELANIIFHSVFHSLTEQKCKQCLIISFYFDWAEKKNDQNLTENSLCMLNSILFLSSSLHNLTNKITNLCHFLFFISYNKCFSSK